MARQTRPDGLPHREFLPSLVGRSEDSAHGTAPLRVRADLAGPSGVFPGHEPTRSESSADVRFRALSGLKSDITLANVRFSGQTLAYGCAEEI
jgi:hypothetical protein